MGRATVDRGSPDGRTSILDRSSHPVLFTDGGRSDASARGGTGTGPLLPKPADSSQAPLPAEEPGPGFDVTVHQIWDQLSGPDRQRFGQCFSVMVLKALGLRCSEEVTP
jgi:hypothetical protein